MRWRHDRGVGETTSADLTPGPVEKEAGAGQEERVHLPEVDQAAAQAAPCQRTQLGIVEAVADRSSTGEARTAARRITLERPTERCRVRQLAVLDEVQPAVVEQPRRPVDPPAGAGRLAFVRQEEGHPERTTRGAADVAEPDAHVMSARPDIDALLDSAGQESSDREPLEVHQL